MPDQRQFEQGLRRILWTLRDYLNDLTVIGGWVPHLYRQYGGFTQWSSGLSRTGELDVLVPAPLAGGDRPTISTLLSEAGFVPVTEDRVAAVWENDPRVGERIEFLIPHRGTALQIGEPTSVAGQPRLGAIALTDLDLMKNHTTIVHVPVTGDPDMDALPVRVPLLGAYIATKSAMFVKRRPIIENGITTANPKAGKDLVYVRDLMAAGDEVTTRIAAEIAGLKKHSQGNRYYLETAASRLADVIRSGPRGVIELAAREIAERDRVTTRVARADIIGYLTDCREMLEQ